MSSMPFLFLVLIVGMGGVIAFLADRLGRKLGKKRLSFLKLRPRHTAELMTVGAGVLIPLLTITILFVASAEIRKWIREGPNALRERDTLRVEVNQLGGNILSLRDTQAKLEVRNKQLQETGEQLAKDYARAKTDLKKAATDLKKANSDLVSVQTQRDRVQAQANRALSQLASTTRALTSSQRQLTESKRQYAALQKSLKDLSASKHDVDSAFKQASQQLRDIQLHERELDRDVQRLEGEKSRLEGEVKQLSSDKEDLEQQYQKVLAARDRLQEDLQEAAHELELIQIDKERLSAALDASLVVSRTKSLVFPVGTELARITLQPNQSPAEARAALQALLIKSRETADLRGAKPSPGEQSAALRDLTDRNGNRISVEAQKDALVKSVSSLPEESVLVAYSLWNAFEGESVPLQIRPYRNPLVYKAGDVIAESRIDGRLTKEEISRLVDNFLQTGVRERAQKDHMIPNGMEGSYGSVTIAELSAIVEDLKTENKRVRLQAVAKNDTRAADPLLIYFRIRY